MNVRDAMLPDPTTLPAGASAKEAAEHLVRPDVRAVLVVGEDGRLVGIVTPDSLVERVVAAGRDPATTTLAEAAVDAPLTLDADTALDDAYRLMEREEVERAPVTEGGRLVGVLSRSVVQRRLAEDEGQADEPYS